jgi:hypothetical protein
MSCRILALCATLFCAFLSLAQTPVPSLTILLKFEHPGSAVSLQAMQNEIRYLLGNSFRVEFGSTTDWTGSTSGRLVVFNVSGLCSTDRPTPDQPRGLALGSTIVSEGNILPFGRVECDRIRASIQTVSHETAREAQQQLGQAMGRVVVHELYHMLSGSPVHTKRGVTKPGLSPFELTANTANLPRESAEAMEMTDPNQRQEISSSAPSMEIDHR